MTTPQPALISSLVEPISIAPPEIPQLGFFARLRKILFSPATVFADVNRAPRPLLPLIALTLVILTTGLIVQWQVRPDWRKLTAEQADRILATQGITTSDLTPEQQQEYNLRVNSPATAAALSLPISAIISPIFICFIALLFWFGTLGLKCRTTYTRVLSVVAWSFLSAGLVSSLIPIAGSFTSRGKQLNLLKGERFMSTNLSVLVSATDHAIFSAFLKGFDFFLIWALILSAIGLAAVSRKKTTRQVAIIPLGFWTLWVLVRVGMAAFRG